MGSVAGGKEVTETADPPPQGSGGQAVQRPAVNVQRSGGAMRVVSTVVAVVIGALFVYAGAVKVLDPVGFAGDIENYKTLPWPIGVRLAFYLPWLEILCGLALITRRLFPGGVFILTILMSVFIIATIAAKARGLDISCGCFGHATKSLSFVWHLALDFLLLGGLLFLWRRPRESQPAG
jgi:putative oxidoreductase